MSKARVSNNDIPITESRHTPLYLMMIKQREILLSQRFFPEFGGSIRLLFEMFRLWPDSVSVICHDYMGEDGQVSTIIEKNSQSLEIVRSDVLQDNWGLDSFNRLSKALRMTILGLFAARKARRVFCARIVPEGIAGLIASRFSLSSKSLIAFAHGEEILACQSSRQLDWLLAQVSKRVDLVIANSEYTAKLLAPYVDSSAIAVITPGVDLEEFSKLAPDQRSNQRKELSLAQSDFLLLTVARLDSRKNHLAVIKALERLVDKFPSIQYRIIGDGPLRKVLEREVQARGLSENAKIITNASDALRNQYLQTADLFIMPSIQSEHDTEGFGMVFLEAAACGVPCISGSVGGQAEAVRDDETGLVVDGADLQEVYAALLRLLEDRELLTNLSNGAYEYAKTQDWGHKREELLEELNRRGL